MAEPAPTNETVEQIFARLKSKKEGLTTYEAGERLKEYGTNSLRPPQHGKGIILFFSQFKSPLILLLIFACLISFFLGDHTDSTIIIIIVILSGTLGFFQEWGAINAVEKLLQLVENKVSVLRDGNKIEIPLKYVVPGDIVYLAAGNLVPADAILMETNHFFVNEASLTGESVPVEKNPGVSNESSPLKQNNKVFMGTVVASGLATVVVVATGRNTEYGHIFERMRFRPPETAFELGARKFGYFLMEITFVLTISIFAFNIFLKKPILDSFLFSVALAVGITPQLLPAIISINLAHGARRMAKSKVVVKRLPSIENFGQMDILCADKTGTITEGKIKLEKTIGIDEKPNDKVAFYGFLNSHFQAGYANPLDKAILDDIHKDAAGFNKKGEIPYDFNRKRLGVILENQGKQLLIVKGAVAQVLSICDRAEMPDGSFAPLSSAKQQIDKLYEEHSSQGFRLLAIAYGETNQETNLIFLGFLQFFDPIKSDIAAVLQELKKKGVSFKLITGDNHLVAAHVASILGLNKDSLILGNQLRDASDQALLKIVNEKSIFAEIEPNHKERIILALRGSNHVVGYLGDGVNDVSALHSADVGIAVESGADAAKEAADIVLLKKDLSVIRVGIEEGRRTFANTMKYVYMAVSANFGNMFSMAGASLFLSFLPLLPKQVLLTNFLSDFPEIALATDRVDGEIVEKPVKWDQAFIRHFMMVFGLLNSCADYLTFGVLILILKADDILFRSGWFIENVVTAALIVLVIRTRRPFWRSKPGVLVTIAVFAISALCIIIPYTSLGTLFGFKPPPLYFYPYLAGVTVFFIISVEIAKHFFFRKNIHKQSEKSGI